MKKTLFISTAMILAIILGVSALADGFVSSPSNNTAPDLETATTANGEAVSLDVASFGDRSELSEEAQKALEEAYDDIVEAKDVTTLSSELAAIAKEEKIAAADLAVSDLFDISYTDGAAHDGQKINITISSENLDKFVALLHYTNDAWEVVEDAKVDGDKLSFSVDSLSPFAIVVNTNNVTPPPHTGDSSSSTWLYIIMMVAAAAVLVFVVVKRRKASQMEK